MPFLRFLELSVISTSMVHAFFAFAARSTFAHIAFDAKQRKIAHGLQEDRDGTYVFAKCPIILKSECQCIPTA